MILIAKNTVVSMRYIMKDKEGSILENTINGDPVNYLHGANTIIPLLQTQLEGLKTGDRKSVYLNAESGFTNTDFIFEIIIDDVRLAMEEELILGYPVKINFTKCDEACECYTNQL